LIVQQVRDPSAFRACEEFTVVSAFRRTCLVRLKPDTTQA
jgi:hypothetical protein